MVVLGQSCCIRAGCFNRANGCIRAKVVVFGQKWLYSGKIVCIRAKCFCSGKMIVIEEGGCIWPSIVVAFVALLHLYKVVLFGQSCCIKAKVVGFGQTWLYSGKVVVFR